MLFAALIGACASHTQLGSERKPLTESAGVGTLATVGTFEMELAPAKTRLEMCRRNAKKALIARRIDVDTARDIQRHADNARAALERAADAMGPRKQATHEARDSLAEAMSAIQYIEQELLPK